MCYVWHISCPLQLAIILIALLTHPLSLAAEPSPDFDGNGVVDIPDFLLFVDAFGSQEGQEKYEAKFDLNGDGKIADEDFQIFISSFGKDMNEPPPSDAVVRAATNASSMAMYWVDNRQNRIQCAYLNGQNIRNLVTGLGSPSGIALDLLSNKMYWTDRGRDKIQRADLNGENIEDLVTGLANPMNLALDLSSNKMYWTDNGTKKIQRADLNGENIQDVVTGLSSPSGIALDISGNKLYWTDRGRDKIQRADLNGENIEDLITDLNGPAGIALDVSGGKMYWVDNGTDKIQRADLNGENIEDLVTGLGIPWGITLDLSSNKMYWTDNGTKKIQRADLNGQDIEDVLTIELGTPVGIALGSSNSKLLNRVPVFTSRPPVTRSIDENIPSEQPIGDPIYATDADGDPLTYSLSGTDADSFVIDMDTGQIQTEEGITYDYEAKKSYSVTVKANDGQSETASIAVKITLNDVKEPPSSPPSNFMVIPSEQSLTVHYADVPDEPGKPPVRGYYAEIRKGEDGTWGNRRTIYGRTNTSVYYRELKVPRYYDPYLTNGQLYQVRVCTWNADGASDWSEPVSGTPVDEPQKVQSQLAQFQGEGDMASAEIDLSSFTGEGGKVLVTRAALPVNISQEEVKGIFVEIIEIEASNAPAVPPHKGFTISDSTSLFDIDLKALVNKQNVDIGSALREPVEICLPVPEDIFDPVMIYYDGTWEMLEEQRVDGSVICAFTNEFSLFGVGEIFIPPPPPPPTTEIILSGFAKSMYWIDSGTKKIQRANIDGSNIQDLVTELDVAGGLAIAGDKMYWPSYTGFGFSAQGKIQRANLDGSNVEDLITMGLKAPLFITIAGDKMYWIDSEVKKIRRADLDGRNTEDVIAIGQGALRFLVGDLTVVEGKIYWWERPESTSKLKRADLDGSNREELLTVMTDFAFDLAITENKVYWTTTPGKVWRADFDGSNSEIVLELAGAKGLALDSEAGKMYITNGISNKIQRANLDGSNIEDLVTGLDVLEGIALHDQPVAAPKAAMYWTDDKKRKIQRANLELGVGETTRTATNLVTGLVKPVSIALDIEGGKMYWVESKGQTDKIQRASLNGLNIEDLITTGLTDPKGIALDISGNKMYWMDLGTDKIQRADLDGSNVEDLITTGLDKPVGIALDISGNKMYWTDFGTDKIQRADLDGSDAEDLITTGLTDPKGIALDIAGGKMYWTDLGTDKIQRADLDGSNVEDLITTGLTNPGDITLDIAGGKMYWTNIGADKIQRADLNGSNVEDMVTITADGRLSDIALNF